MSEKQEENKSIKLKVQEARKRDVGRSIIRIDSDTMQELTISTGDIIKISNGDEFTAAIAWPAYPQDRGLGIVRIDGRIRQNVSVSLDEIITIQKVEEQAARKIVLAPISIKIKPNTRFESFVKRKIANSPITKGDSVYINIGMTKEIIFRIVSLQPEGICVMKNATELSINESNKEAIKKGIAYITYEDIGGLDREIQLVREMVELPLKHPELFTRLGIDPPKGVLLRGPPGCGKTLLAKAVANESKAHFISINGPEIMSKFYGESEKKLRGLFKEAEDKSPSIIFIDEIDAIAPKREKVSGEVERRVVAQMLALMDGLESRGRVVIIGATNRPNAVDPALRRPGRLDRELEIKVPNEKGRMDILLIHTRKMPMAEEVQLSDFAAITHGYVGADIASLVQETGMAALRRYLPEIDLDEPVPLDILEKMEVRKKDFDHGFKVVVPSGIREVFIEIPKVHWSDVGGLERIKQQLVEAVEWPIKNIQSYHRLGIDPPTGLLLYGPPGCGKTLLARAVATESEANFISIKGPELLSKWVGESEKAIREVFRKAKLAAPCIIFFDELDSIAAKRGSSGTESGVTERVISQLLTELDGLSQAKEIILIAATNRPDILDPALIRPGRIDRLSYVPPPEEEDRLKIFTIFTEKMPLDDDVDLQSYAQQTEMFSGADIESLCREAAIRALRDDIRAEIIHDRHFKDALSDIRASINQEMCDWYEGFEDKLKSKRIGKKKKSRDLYS